MRAKSIIGDTLEEVKVAFKESLADGFKPSLAFVIIPYQTDNQPFCKLFNKKGISIFGVSRFGKEIEDPITIKEISVLLLDLHSDYFKIIFEEHNIQSPELAAESIAKEAKNTFKNSSLLVYASNFRINFSKMLGSFTRVLGDDVNLFGAVSGTDETITDGLVFTNHNQSKNGLLALVFNADKIHLSGDVYSGWNSVGTVKTVTKSNENVILEIDNKPAVDITMKYGGIKDLPSDFFEATMLVSRTLAMNFLRDKGDPVTLIGLVLPEERALITNANCPVGSKIQFALPPEFDVIDSTKKRFKRLQEEVPEPDVVLLYNCMNRLDVLGPFVEEEVNAIRKLWNTPMTGFMSNGEIGRAKNGELEILNCTQICVVLKEN